MIHDYSNIAGRSSKSEEKKTLGAIDKEKRLQCKNYGEGSNCIS